MVRLNANTVPADEQASEQAESTVAAEAATAVEDRPNEPAPAELRTITLPLPTACQTRVVLLVRQVVVPLGINDTPQSLWLSGCRVDRDYDPAGGYDRQHEEFPDCTEAEEIIDEGWELLGDAVITAARSAANWIQFHTEDSDSDTQSFDAHDAIEAWIDEFDPDTATEAIFDEPADAAGAEAKPATNVCSCCQDNANVTVTVEPWKDAGLTDEAQKAWDERKRGLEEKIGKLAVEAAHLKARVKSNRETMAEYTKELESHIDRGPEQLPLFDRKPAACQATEPVPEPAKDPAESQAQQDPTESEADAQQPAEGHEPWRSIKIADIDGLTPKIVEILDGHDIHTLGDWVDVPKLRGIEYTQLKGITEKRLETIQAAMMQATCE